MIRILGNLVGLIVATAVVGFFAAPYVGFFGIRAAADAGDQAGLERLIDYAAVRRSLGPQLEGRAEATAPAPGFLEDPIGAVVRGLERPTPDRQAEVDAYLTPVALAALTRGEGRFAAQRSRSPAPTEAADGGPWPTPRHWGVDRARMTVEDEGGSQTVFTFERRGLYEWKLVHVGLPVGAATTPAPVPRVGDNVGRKRVGG
ncbi:MAG TPA: DUF2939 domain-containing protein [Brevundimonas sp.]|jgi:hypothetical protein|uniref:DUF2939 domain-containing protein n=1 Tax=Brevundimonas sp. TaxID=1871086 RepID=UPI002DEFD97F|nr:DUF2939 domain-containing protein [Brevundimonas sp.]